MDHLKHKKFALVRAPYRKDVTDLLDTAIREEITKFDGYVEVFDVHGAFEIPTLIAMLDKSDKGFDAYITIGCILKGETIHDEVIAYPVYDALSRLQIDRGIIIGNAILTVNTKEQAIKRADPNQENRGGEAVKAALGLLNHKYNLGL